MKHSKVVILKYSTYINRRNKTKKNADYFLTFDTYEWINIMAGTNQARMLEGATCIGEGNNARIK